MGSFLLALALLGGQAETTTVLPAPSSASPVVEAAPSQARLPVSKRLAKIMARSDGSSKQEAYKVRNVPEEYEVIKALGMVPLGQSLVIDGDKAYDVLQVRDPGTGSERDIWFDISSFFGRGFGF